LGKERGRKESQGGKITSRGERKTGVGPKGEGPTMMTGRCGRGRGTQSVGKKKNDVLLRGKKKKPWSIPSRPKRKILPSGKEGVGHKSPKRVHVTAATKKNPPSFVEKIPLT